MRMYPLIFFVFVLILSACSLTQDTRLQVSPAVISIETLVPTRSSSAGDETLEFPPAPTQPPQPIETQALPAVEKTPVIDAEETATAPQAGFVEISVVYDNVPFDPRLKTNWGFAALVSTQAHTLLFDTGGDGATLLGNMQLLGIDTHQIESVVLSHAHGDHTGGLFSLLDSGIHPSVYVLPSFQTAFKNSVRQRTNLIETTTGQVLAQAIYTTGEMGKDTPEQALIIQAKQGLVVVTGCAHPGIVEIVRKSQDLFSQPVYLVMGGFHLGGMNTNQIKSILAALRELGVVQVAPSHCTGDLARAMFAEEYGNYYIQSGAGKIIRMDMKGP
jgi:7,8-dihydropterin-6-yl-methyl-4-(beta-D-ribofuranosyl)aminobenzene 5'-phosphate synthase